MPADISLVELVHLAKHRWIIERDYQELKQELGLGNYEGRGWHGFHHHATLCIAAYGFPVAERIIFPLGTHGQSWITSPRTATALPAPRFAAFAPSGIVPVRLPPCE